MWCFYFENAVLGFNSFIILQMTSSNTILPAIGLSRESHQIDATINSHSKIKSKGCNNPVPLKNQRFLIWTALVYFLFHFSERFEPLYEVSVLAIRGQVLLFIAL